MFDEDLERPKYIKCNGIECKKLEEPTISSSSCDSGEDLILDGSNIVVCFSASQKIEFNSNKTNYYNKCIENNENNIFGTKENGDYVYISIFYNAIILADVSECKINIILNNEFLFFYFCY